jgi:hypothetical protein
MKHVYEIAVLAKAGTQTEKPDSRLRGNDTKAQITN